MEHITSFLREEGDEAEAQSVKTATPPKRSPPENSPHPSSHSSYSSQSADIELHSKGQGHVSATQINVSTPTAEAEHFNPGFVPIKPLTSLPLYSPISSGMLPATVRQHQHATRGESVPLLLNTQFCPFYDAGTAFQSRVQPQIVAPTPTYQHPRVPYIYTTVAPSSRQPVAAPPAFSFSVPHYNASSSVNASNPAQCFSSCLEHSCSYRHFSTAIEPATEATRILGASPPFACCPPAKDS
ncbi:hypothetical protein PO909_022319 [Leuciscus waleckii]